MRRWRKRNASSPANSGRSGRMSSLRTSAVSWDVSRGSSGVSAWTTPWWNTSPSTAPRSSTDRSGGSSWSRRAVSSAWSVGGTSTSPSPEACTIAAISSTKSGLPPAARRIRSRTSASSSRPPMRASISASASSGASGCSRRTPPQPLRRSSSSGRAMQSSRIGAPVDRNATCSRRSRKTSSPHWMSSNTATTGPRPRPPRAACGTPTRSRPSTTCRLARAARRAPSAAAGSSSSRDRCASSCFSTSTTGQ